MSRGDVYRVRLPGARYGIVVQASQLAPLSTAVIVPTSKSAAPASFRPEIAVGGERTRALPEQLLALDVRRFGSFSGRLQVRDLEAVDDALRLVLGLR